MGSGAERGVDAAQYGHAGQVTTVGHMHETWSHYKDVRCGRGRRPWQVRRVLVHGKCSLEIGFATVGAGPARHAAHHTAALEENAHQQKVLHVTAVAVSGLGGFHVASPQRRVHTYRRRSASMYTANAGSFAGATTGTGAVTCPEPPSVAAAAPAAPQGNQKPASHVFATSRMAQ